MKVSDEFRDQLIAAIPSLRAFAVSLCGNATRADDLVQETLVKAWANHESSEPGTNLRAWLYTILRNEFYSQMRKKAREIEARFSMLETLADHDDLLMEQLLEEKEPPRDEVFDDLSADLREGTVTPVLIGTAEKGNGVLRLLKAIRHDAPDVGTTRKRLGVQDVVRLRQAHLDVLIMGGLLTAAGSVPGVPTWARRAAVVGAWTNPLLFVPLAFDPKAPAKKSYGLASAASFTVTCAGWFGIARAARRARKK